MLNKEIIRNDALNEEYYKIIHPSGLTVLVYPKKFSVTYALFSTHYGSLERTFRKQGDADFQTVPDGIAHFLEHKLFEQEDGSDVFSSFAQIGASANAYTSNELTSYLFSTTENAMKALEILIEFVMHPYFTEQNVQKEQGIIGQEIGMYDDHPGSCLYYALLEGLFRQHNIRINIAGTVKTIAEITPEWLYHCYNTFYQPSNMALAICGDVSAEEVMEAVDRVLPDRPTGKKVECLYPQETAEIANAYTELHMEVAKPLFAFGVKDLSVFDTPEERMRHGIAMNMFNDLLFATSSPFVTKLYDKGLISGDFSAEYEWMSSCAFNAISGESDDPDAVYAEVMDLIEKTKTEPPAEEDFLRIRRSTYAAYLRSFDSTESITGELIHNTFHGVEFLQIGDMIRSITYQEIVALAQTYYIDKTFVRAVVLPMNTEQQGD